MRFHCINSSETWLVWIITKTMKRIQHGKSKILDNGFPWVNCKRNYKIWKFSEIFVVFLELSSVLKRINMRFHCFNSPETWLVCINTKSMKKIQNSKFKILDNEFPWVNCKRNCKIWKFSEIFVVFFRVFFLCWKEPIRDFIASIHQKLGWFGSTQKQWKKSKR